MVLPIKVASAILVSALVSICLAHAKMAQAAPAGKTVDNRIVQSLPRLPVEVFDMTTEGMNDEEWRDLIKKRESENWRVKSVASNKVVFAAKAPFSEVHLSFKKYGSREFLEALTFNERVVSYSYWIAAQAGKPFAEYEPLPVFRAFNEAAEGGKPIPMTGIPSEITDYIELMAACSKPEARVKDAPALVKEQGPAGAKPDCASKPDATKAIRAKFASNRKWFTILENTDRLFGDRN